MSATVAVLVPVVDRPHHAERFMTSLRTSGAAGQDWRAYPICDLDDPVADVWAKWAGRSHVLIGRFAHKPGTFAEKVNYGYQLTAEPWLYLVGSDVRFHPGWLAAALTKAADTGFDVIGTNDLGNDLGVDNGVPTGEHATHMLIRRAYVDELGASWGGPGILCHDGYRHWFVDNELVSVAKQRGTFVVALDSVVEHMHPLFGKAETDAVYALGRQFESADRARFVDREWRFRRRHVCYYEKGSSHEGADAL